MANKNKNDNSQNTQSEYAHGAGYDRAGKKDPRLDQTSDEWDAAYAHEVTHGTSSQES